MRIGELADASGVPTKTTRYYEDIGLMPPPARTPTGYREYEPDSETRLGFIRAAQSVGLTSERSERSSHSRSRRDPLPPRRRSHREARRRALGTHPGPRRCAWSSTAWRLKRGRPRQRTQRRRPSATSSRADSRRSSVRSASRRGARPGRIAPFVTWVDHEEVEGWSPKERHPRGATWNRTRDLTVIR